MANGSFRLTWLVLLGLGAVGARALEVALTTNMAPAGFVEVLGVEADEFDPRMWQAGGLNLVPDRRVPLLSPAPGKFRNIYAPSAVEVPGGYRLFYGAWDGVPTGNDRIYSTLTDRDFQDFQARHAVIEPGGYVHVCNVNALRLEDGAFALHATVYPVAGLNKPGFFKSDASAQHWNGRGGEPYSVQPEDIVQISGYAFAEADINGMNVLLQEEGFYRLYFGDFKNRGVFRASSPDGKHYEFEAKVLADPYWVNDVKRFRVGRTDYYLMGLHANGAWLWQTLSTNGLVFPPSRTLLTNATAADRYIVALGWVVRGRQESAGRKLIGVLYGAGPAGSLDRNAICARWLQKRVVWVAEDGRRFPGTSALGPDRQFVEFPNAAVVRGRIEVYAEDGQTRLGASGWLRLAGGQTVRLIR